MSVVLYQARFPATKQVLEEARFPDQWRSKSDNAASLMMQVQESSTIK
jgi:hypothetical protein